ncbi:MAG TPA: hypothetical protein VFS05_10605 [Gemmatimonadaceae bacterium]|nr:hypothetical protein [Gemmatimonadaceae bacterium]
MSRRVSLLVLALASLALSACSSVTGPDTTRQDACGIFNGTGTKSCDTQ